ncbi:NF-kappa-B inhibitor-like protein 1 [Taenia solium]|eukprot:TsM_001194200 transcript=TsM_001194200 gene=TsM_001194200
MQCSLQGDLFGKIRPPKRRCNDAILEDAWQERLVDELNADFPRHEEYFQGRFTDAESNSAKKAPFMIYCGISQLLTSVSHAEGEASANRMPLYVCVHTYALDLTLPLSRLRSWKYSTSATGRFFRSPELESTQSISRFTDADASSGDFFEDIRKEYERKKSRCMHRPQPESNQPSASNTHTTTSTRDDEFRRRHAEALRNRGLPSPVSNLDVSVLSYEQYSERWQTFLRSGTNRDIPWPPVKVGDTEELLRFAGRSLLHLRQLQVDWHPDRFFARLPSHVQRTEELANRVTALSQFFNKAVVELRSYVEKLKQ